MSPPISFTNEKLYEITFSEEFRETFLQLSESVRDEASVPMELLESAGPNLRRPYADKLDMNGYTVSFSDARELRWREERNEWRALYVWQGKMALMLAVGQKSGYATERRFYRELFNDAEKAWRRHRAAPTGR